MKSKFTALVFLAVLGVITLFLYLQNHENAVPREKTISPEEHQQQELISLLQYIGKDYPAAVKDGLVVSEFEYREMNVFCQRTIKIYAALQPDLEQNFTILQLQQLRQMVYEKLDRHSISELTKALIQELTTEFELETHPAIAPNLAQGKRMYKAAGCDICHGTSGAGDGWAAEQLMPRPGSFREPAKMNESIPYFFFNIIRLGVSGTGMPSYSQALSKPEAWNVAFYLMTLRDDFDPRPDRALAVRLADLATKSNIDLLKEIRDQLSSAGGSYEMQDTRLSAAIDFLRRNPGEAR